MKSLLVYLGLVITGVIAGMLMNECRRGGFAVNDTSGELHDTVRKIDTVRYSGLASKREIDAGVREGVVRIRPNGKALLQADRNLRAASQEEEKYETSSFQGECEDSLLQGVEIDMIAEIPVTQREYEGEDYRAWVSGWEPRLDSIQVYSRRERVTIRKPPDKPKRWGIGVFAGYGYTPKGLQPCVGISINYNLWNF